MTAHPGAQWSRHNRLSLLSCSHDPLVDRSVLLGRPATRPRLLISRQWRPKYAGRWRLAVNGDATPSAELLTALVHSWFTAQQVR